MWPPLLERAPMDSVLILKMEKQHERIAELHRRAADSAAGFVRAADTGSRADLADTLTELVAALGNTCTTKRCTSFRWSSRC
jgi:hypothetical protein